MSLVSVVMPAWRPRPEWLEVAVRAALDETCAVEVVVVDDGSDPPVQLRVDDQRVRLVRAEHCGPYAARDVGLAHATGTHVRFLDADDVSIPGSTTRMLDRLGDRDDRIVHGDTELCDDALVPYEVVGSDLEGDAVDACLLGSFSVFHVSLLYPRRVVDAAGPWDLPDFRVSGDWDYVLRALEHAPVVRHPEVVTRYRRHPGSVMSSARVVDGGDARRRIIERHLERHPERRGSPVARRALGRSHVDQAAAHAWRGERAAAARQLATGARLAPADAARTAVRLAGQRLRMLRG